MSHNSIEFFARFIEKETGIRFHDSNLYQLKSRLEEIVKSENLASVDELAQKFQSIGGASVDLKNRLLDHSTNNETLFFRDPSFFTAIEAFIEKEILPKNPREIRIWSAASSTGQEALSVAMTLEAMAKRLPLPPYKILATDISHRALDKARSGTYTDFEVRRGLDESKKSSYFTQEADGNWKVKPNLLSKITYAHNNLIRSSVNDSFHIILCRNVLIYQDIPTKKIVVNKLYENLETSGGLLLGVGETLLGLRENVSTSMVGNVIFYRKDTNKISEAS